MLGWFTTLPITLTVAARSKRFPNATQMVEQFHGLGIRTMLWMTSMIDTDSPNFAYAKSKDYLVSKGRTVKWWHGHGAFLDYTYADAKAWWESLLDNVLVGTGVDGFKCDGTDPFIMELDIGGSARGHNGNKIHYRQYADYYYGHTFNYSQSKNPYALIMARPVDSWDNTLYWRFAPRYVSFSGWVGDEDPNFSGLVEAMNNMLQSAWANYVSFGSDTGGYRSGPSPSPLGRTRETLLRWAQLNALMGFFENGGDNEHRPWKFDGQPTTTDIYRYFVNLHQSLATYLLTSGTAAYESGRSIITPVASKPPLPIRPGTYAYWLGPSVFVDPVLVENVTTHTVTFPKGSDFVDWFNTSVVYKGGSTVVYPCPLDESMSYPVFHKQGSLLVRNIRNSVTLPLVPAETEPLNVFVAHPRVGQSGHTPIRRFRQRAQEVSYVFETSGRLVFTTTAHARRLSLTIAGVPLPRVCKHLVTGQDLLPRSVRVNRMQELEIADIDCSAGAVVVLQF